jgi:hypothetical protein
VASCARQGAATSVQYTAIYVRKFVYQVMRLP